MSSLKGLIREVALFYSLHHITSKFAYGNCGDLRQLLNVLFTTKVNFEKKIRYFSLTYFRPLSLFNNVTTPYYPMYALLSVKWSLMGGGCLRVAPNIEI